MLVFTTTATLTIFSKCWHKRWTNQGISMCAYSQLTAVKGSSSTLRQLYEPLWWLHPSSDWECIRIKFLYIETLVNTQLMAENKECWEVRRHYIFRQTTVLLLPRERLNIYFLIVSLINTVLQLVYNYKAVQLTWNFFLRFEVCKMISFIWMFNYITT